MRVCCGSSARTLPGSLLCSFGLAVGGAFLLGGAAEALACMHAARLPKKWQRKDVLRLR